MKIESKCLHAGYEPKNGEPRVLPIYQSTTYKYDSTDFVGQLFDLTAEGHMYSRISNPTVDAVEKKIAALEGGVGALCTTSGQSATFLALMNVLESGDHLVASSTITEVQSICCLSPSENSASKCPMWIRMRLQRKSKS